MGKLQKQLHVAECKHTPAHCIKAPVLQILLENHELCKYAKISLHIHIIVDLNKKYRFKPTYVHCFA